jgi:hypothetical protein
MYALYEVCMPYCGGGEVKMVTMFCTCKSCDGDDGLSYL